MIGRSVGQIAWGPENLSCEGSSRLAMRRSDKRHTSQILHADKGVSKGVSNCVPHAVQMSWSSLLTAMLLLLHVSNHRQSCRCQDYVLDEVPDHQWYPWPYHAGQTRHVCIGRVHGSCP